MTTYSKLQQVVKKLKRDIKLLLENPIEYLYSFTYSPTKKVTILPFDPAVKQIGYELVSKINEQVPEIKVHFVGSPVIEIPGQKDIDLYIECDYSLFDKYLPLIKQVCGEPSKIRKEFCEWEYTYKNCQVEIVMGNKNLEIIKGPLAVCYAIQGNPDYIKQYAKLKTESNGVSMREYKRRRLEFFHQILKNP